MNLVPFLSICCCSDNKKLAEGLGGLGLWGWGAFGAVTHRRDLCLSRD